MAQKKETKKTIKTGKNKRSAAGAKKGDAYEFSSINLKLSPSEVFGVAIKSEIEATEAYSKLYEKVKNEILRMNLDLFKLALKAEKMSENFYREAGERAGDKESKRVLGYLVRVERSHYFIIKSEIDMLDRFPDYYKVEDFHLGQDMFHVGP